MGMEFPDNVATNVHKIDGIAGIRWSRYSLSSFAVPRSQNGEKSESPHSECAYEQNDDRIGSLQIIENQLRLAGQHVILDAGESVLWLFDLIEANRTATSGNPTKEVTSRMIDEYNLIEVGSGLLQPSELRSNLRSDISAPKSMITSNRLVHPSIDSYPMHGNAFGEYTALGKKALFSPLDVPMTNPVQASQQFNSISLIYLRFLEAVSRSILFQAGVSGKWLPIGSHSFIGPIPSAKSESQARGFGIQEAVHGLTLFLLHIELLPSGSLIVAGTPTLGSQLRRIYNEVETGSGSIGVIVGSDIILVPSGDIYTYDGEADLQSSIRISTQPAQQYPALVSGAIYEADMRASIIHHLIQQGIDVPQGDKWIRLRAKRSRSVFAHGDGARSHFKPESERVLWPASLCFVTSNKAPVEDYDTTCIGKLAKEMSLDPLAHAEAWYRAKYAREESTKAALEKKIKDSELEARLAYEARSPDVQDTHSDSDTRVTQYLSTQEASRIYPTPPDGLRAEVVGPLGTHEPQTTSGGPDDNDGLHSGNDGSALGETQFPASPGFVASSTRYNQATDDDLFGDLETGLFATSGLTEADFSFFDEPSEDDGNEPGTVSPSVRSKPILGINEETASQAAASSCLKTTEAAAENLPDKRKQDRETVAVSSTSGHDRQGPESLDESNQLWASCKLRVSGDVKGNSICSPMQLLDSMSDSFRQIEDYVKMDDGQDKKYLRSSFDSVAFKDRLQDFDSKYVNQGRFGFDSLEPPGVSGHTDQAIGQQIRLPRYPLRQYGIEAGALQASRRALDRCPERRPSQESGVSTSSSSELDDTERDEASEASIVRKDSPASDELRTATKPDNLNPRKRRHEEGWSCSQPATPDFPASLASSHVHDSKPAPSMSCPLLDMFLPAGAIPTEDQLLVMSSKGGPNPLMFTGKDKSFIQIAQILVDQIISQPEILFEYPPNTMMDLQLRRINVEAGFDDPLPQILSCLFTKLECCNLKGYTALARLGPENQLHGNSPARQAPKRPSMVQSSRGLTTSQKSVYKLEAPFTCVRRAGLLVEVCSSALKFWEELGLAPASDPKDIAAFCIYPAQEYVQDGVDAFLSMMGNAYQSCKLGTHIQGSLLPEYQRGLVPVDITSHAITDVLEAIKITCEKLGRHLSQIGAEARNTVVYIVNPFRSRSVLPWLCAAFFKMYDSCMKSLQPNPVSGLVLQIVPLDLIASPQVITLPSAKTYTRLALEVYDRCRPNSVERNRQGSQFRCAPATRLARAVPKTINFRLTSDPSTELLHSDRCFHLSYTWSYNQDWLTASWTDNQGALQWNAAYCLGEEELEPWRTFLAIAREMWETTMEILKPGNSSWRFFIAKDSRMNKEELRVWLSLCSDTRHPFVSTTLITVDPDPPLRFPRSYTLDRNPTIANNPCPTPVSTPLTSTFSPDQTGFVSTPGGTTAQTSAPTPTTGVFDHNSEARLIDITDETWGATIARGLDDPNVPTDCCHASMSGYLIKRAGARDEDGLMAFAVNIIHAQKPDKALLKDVLGMYRGLTMLAKVRGVVDPESNVLPWHVAAAKKAHAVVNSTMRWAGE